MISIIIRIQMTTLIKVIKNLTLMFTIFSGVTTLAQQDEVEIKIQDTLYFNQCTADTYQFIDYYKKTRFNPNDTNDLTHLYNWDFYNSFFNTGDFDVSRLPCSMNGQYGIVKHIMRISDEKKNGQTVVIAMIEKNVSAAYITEEAFLNDELIYAPKK